MSKVKRDKENIYRMGMADPRTGPERLAGVVNRVVQGYRNAPIRSYDDSPTQMAITRKAGKGKGKK